MSTKSPGYGCATCGPHEWCPDDAAARQWEDQEPDGEAEPVSVAPHVIVEEDPW